MSQIEELVCGLAHGADDGDDLVTFCLGGDDALGGEVNFFGVGDRGAAEFLDDEGQAVLHWENGRIIVATPPLASGPLLLLSLANPVYERAMLLEQTRQHILALSDQELIEYTQAEAGTFTPELVAS